MKKFFTINLLALLMALLPMLGRAAAFTPGNIVVVRVGDGSAALSGAASAVFLVEYTPTGTLVQTIPLPAAAAGGNFALVTSGSSTSEGALGRSSNGQYLALTGYDAAVGTASVSSAASLGRVVGIVDATGVVSTTTRFTDGYTGSNIRSAVPTDDGLAFFTGGTGTGGGTRYVLRGGTTSTQISSTVTNTRVVNIIDGQLYTTAGSGTFQGVAAVGTGIPTTTGQTTMALPGFPTASGPSPYAFVGFDLSATVPGIDVLYIADDRSTEGIQKWSLVTGTWTQNGTIGGSTTATLRGLTASRIGNTITLFASGGGGIYTVTDNAGYNATPSTTMLPAPIVTAATNTAFRGIAYAPTNLSITSISPATTTAGTATTITVTGTGFTNGAVINFNGTALTTVFVFPNQLAATIPATALATTGTYNVTVTSPTGGTSAASPYTVNPAPTPAPTVTSFTPTSGPSGTAVTITGTNLTGATAVTVNGMAITGFTVVSPTSITFTVPAGATSGPVSVTTPGGTATGGVSFIVTAAPPTISSLSPGTAVAGAGATTLTVNGTNFVSGATVSFNGTTLTTTFVSATQLTATIPATALATAGSYNVTVTNPAGGGTSTASPFTVTVPAPTITSLSPATGAPGTLVTINGTNFTGATAVTLNGAPVTYTVVSATMITFPLANGATSGPIAVTTAGGTATSSTSFTVLPVAISSFSPTSGASGTLVTVNGQGFVGVTGVTLNGAPVTYTVVSATMLTFQLANGATSGPVVVTTAGGTATSSTSFTVLPVAITSFTPTSGGSGTVVTVSGQGFVGVTGITINGVAATFSVSSATLLTLTVPAGATTGPIVVTTTGGTATSTTNFTVTGPAPTLTSFSPTSGVSGTLVTITGTNFTNVTNVTLNGATITGYTVVSPTSITFTLPATATSGPIAVTTASGTATSTGSFTVNNPAPTITSLSPGTAVAGAAATLLTVNGTGFVSGATISFNGTTLTTTFVSATQLTATIPATSLATAGSYNVTVTNPAGGGTSTASPFTVTAPAPVLTLTPTTLTAFTTVVGTASATQPVTVGGSNLTAGITVTAPAGYQVSLSATTGFASSVTLPQTGGTVAATPVYVRLAGTTAGAVTGTLSIASTGATSQTVALSGTVNALPAITSLAPGTAVAGAAATTLTVNGTGFVSGATVSFNGTNLTTTFVSATQLTATIPAASLTTAGAYSVTVTNPAGGGTSAASTFTVTVPAPTITSFSPTSATPGTSVTINGTNFVNVTSVTINGLAITGYTVVSPIAITFTVPATATSGPLAVTTAGGTVTSTTSFTVVVPNPVPTITSITPSSGVVGTTITATINGTGFLPASALLVGGMPFPATYVSPTQLTLSVLATFPAGVYPVEVVNPLPGGGTSVAATFTLNNPTPTITSLTPNTAPAGSASRLLTVNGSNFVVGATIEFNGVGLSTNYISDTQLTAAIPAASLATAGSYGVIVTNPAPSVAPSAASTFLVTAVPTITSFSPLAGPVGSTVTITGTNFTGATTVRFNGVATTNFTVVNSTTITVVVPAGATSGLITVVTPGSTASSTASFLVGTGTREASQAQLSVYPNPVREVLTIRFEQPAAGHAVVLRDLLGRVMRQAELPASGQLSLAGLPTGTYLLSVDGTLIRRITKE